VAKKYTAVHNGHCVTWGTDATIHQQQLQISTGHSS